MEQVEEVVPGAGVRPLWGAHPWVVGVLVRRGRVFGVIDPAGPAAGEGPGAGEVLVMRGEPALALRGAGMDAVTREFVVEGAGGEKLTCGRGTFSILLPEEIRKRVLAGEPPIPGHGEEHGKEDPAG